MAKHLSALDLADGTKSAVTEFDSFADFREQQLAIYADKVQEAIFAGHSREVLRYTSLIEQWAKAWTAADAPKPKQGFDISKLQLGSELAKNEASIRWVVNRLIPENSIILFYAKGGSGKSTLATQLAAAVCDGSDFLGLATAARPVVIVDYENPVPVLTMRINRTAGADKVHFWTTANDPPPLTDANRFDELQELVRTLVNPVLIIDTLSGGASEADILSNRDFSPVMHRLKQLRELGCTIILLHHTPKADQTKYIGASTIYNQCDHVLAMYPVKAPGSTAETSEEESGVYRFGTKDKTRFDHHHLHVEFNDETGLFQLAADPDQHLIDQLKTIIDSNAGINQTALARCIGSNVPDRKIRKILKAHDGTLWQSERGSKNAVNYFKLQLGTPTDPVCEELPSWYINRCESGKELNQ